MCPYSHIWDKMTEGSSWFYTLFHINLSKQKVILLFFFTPPPHKTVKPPLASRSLNLHYHFQVQQILLDAIAQVRLSKTA